MIKQDSITRKSFGERIDLIASVLIRGLALWHSPSHHLAELYTMVAPNFRALMESYQNAQSGAGSKADGATLLRTEAASPVVSG